MTATAKLIFHGSRAVSLPQVLERLRGTLRDGDLAPENIRDATLNSLRLKADGLELRLSLALIGEETHLALALDLRGTHRPLARLAQLTYTLVKCTHVHEVIWDGTHLRIPRAEFLGGLEHCFDTTLPERPDRRGVVPRRVTIDGAPALPHPAFDRYRTRASDEQADAHVQLYHKACTPRQAPVTQIAGAATRRQEADLRAALCQRASPEELASLGAPTPRLGGRLGVLAAQALSVLHGPDDHAA